MTEPRRIRCGPTSCPHDAVQAYRVVHPDLPWHWPDGPGYYGLACASHRDKVNANQARLGHVVEWFDLDQVTIVLGCAAYWGSHGCGLSEIHADEHVCLLDWDGEADEDGELRPDECCRPTATDTVLHVITDEPCALLGGVCR